MKTLLAALLAIGIVALVPEKADARFFRHRVVLRAAVVVHPHRVVRAVVIQPHFAAIGLALPYTPVVPVYPAYPYAYPSAAVPQAPIQQTTVNVVPPGQALPQAPPLPQAVPKGGISLETTEVTINLGDVVIRGRTVAKK